MKTYKNLFDKICSFENLHLAYLKARKCKRYRSEILKFSYNLEENLLRLQQELLTQTYHHGSYKEFVVCDSKKRKIKAAPFKDRVVHHALCNIIEPIFDREFIYDTYACRENKGTHRAIKRLEKFIKSVNSTLREREMNLPAPKIYCLQCDVSKYFDSIDHQILFSLLRKKIADPKALWLIKIIVESSNKEPGKGIPIGNLTSQLFANVYLNELDQFVKHQLRIKYYIRYMDDFLILHFNKKELHKIKNQIQMFLRDKLKLELHPKKADIFPVDRSVDFLGYRIFRNHRLLRKSTVKRFIKRVKIYRKRMENTLMTEEKFNQSLDSWLAYARFGNSWRLRQNLSEKLKVELIK